MNVGLRVFVGGPRHTAHETIVNLSSDPDIRPRITEVKAFDDEQVKATSAGTASWLNYLRNCDLALFVLPPKKSGTRDLKTGKFYTQMEVEQARLSGTPTYFVVEGGDTELVKSVKAAYENDLAISPIRCARWSGTTALKALLAACKSALLSGIRHWEMLLGYVDQQRQTVVELIRDSGRNVDQKTAADRIHSGCLQEEAIQKYVSECWNLRRQCPRSGELPRHLFRAFVCIVRPCLSHEDIEKMASDSPSGLWGKLAKLVHDRGNSCGGNLKIPEPSKEVFACLSDWRQRALINCLREISVAFRYRLELDIDWAFARRAFQLYQMRGGSIDPDRKLLFSLAISAVTSAAYSLNLHDLSFIDPEKAMLSVLQDRFERDRNPGAAKTLGDYHATLGKQAEAKTFLTESIKKFEGAKAKPEARLHSYVALACCKTGVGRKRIFADLDTKFRGWQETVHPIYSAMSALAIKRPQMRWQDVVGGLQSRSEMPIRLSSSNP